MQQENDKRKDPQTQVQQSWGQVVWSLGWRSLSAPEAHHVCHLKLNREAAVYGKQLNKEKVGLADLRRSGHCGGAGFRPQMSS